MGTLTECGDALDTAARGYFGVKCSKETGYSFANATAKPTAKAIAEFCASSRCASFLKAMEKAVPSECIVSTAGGVRLYRDIINPITNECSEDTNTQKPTPTPSTRTPTPSTTVPKATPTTKTPLSSSNGSSDGLLVAADADSLDASTVTQPTAAGPTSPSTPPATTPSTAAPASLLLTSSPSVPNAAASPPSPSANAGSSASQHETLDVNLLLVVIACGVAIVAIVGFVAFYFDQKRNREHELEPRDSVAVFASSQPAATDALPSTPRDSYDHFSPRPMWAKLNSQGQVCL